jgi:hypothetical protein
MVDPLLFAALKQARLDIKSAEAELEVLRQSIRDFEALVGRRLGDLLDQLSALDAEVEGLTAQVQSIRDQRLYGEHQMHYAEGAPRPEHRTRREYIPNQDVFDEAAPPAAAPFATASSLHAQSVAKGSSQLDAKSELKHIYRRLARTYHPDLAVGGADRAQRTRQMVLINQAYTAGDLVSLRKLWQEEGVEPVQYDFLQPAVQEAEKPELERLQERLHALRQQIVRLNSHPNIQLSMEVKLARQKHRDLLGEMDKELRSKIARKTAERDYLRSQIAANA